MPVRTESSSEILPARRPDSQLVVSFVRWHPRILLVLYCILLTSSILVPIIAKWVGDDVTWLRAIQNTGINIAIVGMIGVLLIPFLRLVDNTSDARNIVSDIRDSVSRFNFPAVDVQPRQDVNTVIAAVDKYDAPTIFLGFKDEALVTRLLNVLKVKRRGALYVHPRVLPAVIQVMDHEEALPAAVYVTDCPRESCAIFGSDMNGRINCVIFRYMPGRDEWWSATLSPGTSHAETESPGTSYAKYLYDTYEHHYTTGAATLVTSQLKARLLREVNKRRIEQNRHLLGDCLPVLTRPLAYSYATTLLKHVQHSIRAVDYMSPRLWTKQGGISYRYRQAHKTLKDKVTKIRIHGFNKNHVKTEATAYLEFIAIHKEMDVDLRFIDESLARQAGIDKGFVIFDNEIVFSAEDLVAMGNRDCDCFTLEDLETAQSASEAAFFDLRVANVASYITRFEELLSTDDSILLTSDAFESRIKAFMPQEDEMLANP